MGDHQRKRTPWLMRKDHDGMTMRSRIVCAIVGTILGAGYAMAIFT